MTYRTHIVCVQSEDEHWRIYFHTRTHFPQTQPQPQHQAHGARQLLELERRIARLVGRGDGGRQTNNERSYGQASEGAKWQDWHWQTRDCDTRKWNPRSLKTRIWTFGIRTTKGRKSDCHDLCVGGTTFIVPQGCDWIYSPLFLAWKVVRVNLMAVVPMRSGNFINTHWSEARVRHTK